MPPSLAILIPVYNAGRFLRTTLESVRAQTQPASEVIVLDNCSTDDTSAITAKYTDLKGFRFERNADNIGAVRNWIEIERLATSDFAMWLPGDDYLAVECVERWQCAAAAHPHVDLFIAGHELVDEAGLPLPAPTPSRFAEGAIPGSNLVDWMLDHGQPNIVAGTIVRRAAYKRVGGYDLRLKGAIDYDLYLHLAGRGSVYRDARPNATVRDHPSQWSKDVYRQDNFDADVLFDKISEMDFLTPTQVRRFVGGLCDYSRQFYSRPLRDPQFPPAMIADERARVVERFRRWRASGKPYAKYVRQWPTRLRPLLAWLAGGTPWSLRAMHHLLARRS